MDGRDYELRVDDRREAREPFEFDAPEVLSRLGQALEKQRNVASALKDVLSTGQRGSVSGLSNEQGTEPPAISRSLRDQLEDLHGALESTTQALSWFGPSVEIAGSERTQAIQFFSFNGEGSGYATDNSVSLVERKALVVRAYVDYQRGLFPNPQPKSQRRR